MEYFCCISNSHTIAALLVVVWYAAAIYSKGPAPWSKKNRGFRILARQAFDIEEFAARSNIGAQSLGFEDLYWPFRVSLAFA
jgi:hypothetical protein